MPAQHLLEDARRETAPAIAIRIPVRLMGAIILGLVAIVLLSLATWQVDDPSLSYASGEPARNWLGFPGAVIADMAFQVFGLGIGHACLRLPELRRQRTRDGMRGVVRDREHLRGVLEGLVHAPARAARMSGG